MYLSMQLNNRQPYYPTLIKKILSHAIPTGVAYFEGKIRIIYTTQLKKWFLI